MNPGMWNRRLIRAQFNLTIFDWPQFGSYHFHILNSNFQKHFHTMIKQRSIQCMGSRMDARKEVSKNHCSLPKFDDNVRFYRNIAYDLFIYRQEFTVLIDEN